jgi:hypothetical protein
MTTHDVTNESHRDGCAECRATWAELERISAEARALPRLTPSRDLWRGIEARIGGASVGTGAPGDDTVDDTDDTGDAATPARLRARRRWFASRAVRMAVAASLLVVATATITWQLAIGRGSGIPDATLADAAGNDSLIPDLAPGDAGLSRPEILRAAAHEIDYSRVDGKVRALQSVVEERYVRLDPRTVEVVRKNLAVIDAAIIESRKALMADPASQFLAAELARAYSTKLTLLRTTAKLSSGT